MSFFKDWVNNSKQNFIFQFGIVKKIFSSALTRTIFFILLSLLEYKILIKLWEIYGLERVLLIALLYRYGLGSNLLRTKKVKK